MGDHKYKRGERVEIRYGDKWVEGIYLGSLAAKKKAYEGSMEIPLPRHKIINQVGKIEVHWHSYVRPWVDDGRSSS